MQHICKFKKYIEKVCKHSLKTLHFNCLPIEMITNRVVLLSEMYLIASRKSRYHRMLHSDWLAGRVTIYNWLAAMSLNVKPRGDWIYKKIRK